MNKKSGPRVALFVMGQLYFSQIMYVLTHLPKINFRQYWYSDLPLNCRTILS